MTQPGIVQAGLPSENFLKRTSVFSYLKMMMTESLSVSFALPGHLCIGLWEVTQNLACVKPTETVCYDLKPHKQEALPPLPYSVRDNSQMLLRLEGLHKG